MAKVRKLMKLKSAIKRWPSLTKHIPGSEEGPTVAGNNNMEEEKVVKEEEEEEVHAVYVGKSRRRYLLRSDVVSHPVFQELVERSSGLDVAGGHEDQLVVACEVVLFEHLLWMLENSGAHQLGSMEELVQFYTP